MHTAINICQILLNQTFSIRKYRPDASELSEINYEPDKQLTINF